ncbi:cytochrome c [Aureimonas jatrophae]|uniref:Cytochrome c, mono-and diheme variants n=1 Tax=Aureimonas jatrophae TaxID=1166073 RepID=A0A1H0HVR0_9HYPH|nr:cytochrome c [Aureimonas jatrophae]MBB3950784.1 mono/diheme cytochrome c family protein [Aureimonas jatrophae]SDO22821.1 Cytochrome c, mono-and diheme variants [Aureimonas jatrophae]
MKLRHLAIGLLVLVLVGAGGFLALAWRSEIAPVERAEAASFAPELVQRGADLAAVGNCVVCHTAPGGKPFAGGLGLPTPFGTIYATNITPDAETGIGRWSEAAFSRSMREGVDREGRHLYPAFPYDHFTLVTDDDNRALYAYLMTREPVSAEAPANELPFPLNVRMVLAGWKLLFFREGPFQPDPAKDGTWNRGAYLAEGLGHCGACHTPRNVFGAERKGDAHWAGGEAEGWTAYALNEASPAPIPWDVDSLTHYLHKGWEARHGVARGPMAPVNTNLGTLPEEESRAIATYVASRMGEPSPERAARAQRLLAEEEAHAPGTLAPSAGSQAPPAVHDAADRGAVLYAGACSTCHDAGRPLPYGGLRLDHSTAISGPTPANPIHVILNGIPAPEGERGPIMPGYAGALDDGQIADLLAYMRRTFSDRPAWDDPAELIAKSRARGAEGGQRSLPTASDAPANPSKREPTW